MLVLLLEAALALRCEDSSTELSLYPLHRQEATCPEES